MKELVTTTFPMDIGELRAHVARCLAGAGRILWILRLLVNHLNEKPMPIPPPPDSKQVFKGLLFDIYQAPRTQFDGTIKTFEYLIRPDSVTIIPFITRDEILLTRQEQPGRVSFLDFPGGRMEPGENPEACAARELSEETGYRAGRLLPIWRYGNNGSSRFEKHFFLATDLTADNDAAKPDSGERITLLRETVEMTRARCLKCEMRQFDAMLCFLSLFLDPQKSAILQGWLDNKPSHTRLD